MTWLALVLLLAGSASIAAVGWYVQLVHYPAFLYVERAKWEEFHRMHVNRTGFVVGLPLGLQFVGTVGVWIVEMSRFASIIHTILFALSFGWTMVISGPLHSKIGDQDHTVIQRLIRSNWVRSIAWTCQAVFCGYQLLTIS